MSNRKRLPPVVREYRTVYATTTFADLHCPDCDSWITPGGRGGPVAYPVIYSATVEHDPTCPTWRRMRRQGGAG